MYLNDTLLSIMSWLTILGLAATLLVEGSYLPQLVRLHRLKHADEFSLLFPLLNLIGRLAGLVAALLHQNMLFCGFFLVGILVRAVLLVQVLHYRSHTRRLTHA